MDTKALCREEISRKWVRHAISEAQEPGRMPSPQARGVQHQKDIKAYKRWVEA